MALVRAETLPCGAVPVVESQRVADPSCDDVPKGLAARSRARRLQHSTTPKDDGKWQPEARLHPIGERAAQGGARNGLRAALTHLS